MKNKSKYSRVGFILLFLVIFAVAIYLIQGFFYPKEVEENLEKEGYLIFQENEQSFVKVPVVLKTQAFRYTFNHKKDQLYGDILLNGESLFGSAPDQKEVYGKLDGFFVDLSVTGNDRFYQLHRSYENKSGILTLLSNDLDQFVCCLIPSELDWIEFPNCPENGATLLIFSPESEKDISEFLSEVKRDSPQFQEWLKERNWEL